MNIKIADDIIVSNVGIRGGAPCIRGTRFTISQLLAELADGNSLQNICKDMKLDFEDCQTVLNAISFAFYKRGN